MTGDSLTGHTGILGALSRLARGLRRGARSAYRLWLENPKHPGLRFKKVSATESVYSARIGLGFRALCLLENDAATWFWIGGHAEYDRLLKQN